MDYSSNMNIVVTVISIIINSMGGVGLLSASLSLLCGEKGKVGDVCVLCVLVCVVCECVCVCVEPPVKFIYGPYLVCFTEHIP